MSEVTDERSFAVSEASFKERQHFTQPWLWLIIIVAAGMAWAGAVQQLLVGKPLGSNPVSDQLLLILWIVFGVMLPGLFVLLRMDTAVRDDGICIRYLPIHWRERCFRFEEIEEVRGRTYSPIREYGGWGIRLWVGGWAYNVRGNKGVQITLRSGKRILIGTQRMGEFMAAVERSRGRGNAL